MIILQNPILKTKEIIVLKSTSSDFNFWVDYFKKHKLMTGYDELHWKPEEGS